MTTVIRPLCAEDFPHVGRIYFCAVHEGTRHAYTLEQRRAWGGDLINLGDWKDYLKDLNGFVAEEENEPVGFMTIDETGYVDLAFVLPSTSGRGIGGGLLTAVENWGKEHGATRLTAAASLVARPFFEKHGWLVVEEEEIDLQGVLLRRFQMQKSILEHGQ